ncbi:MAG: TonB-dependent receptor [Sphingobium sp.]
MAGRFHNERHWAFCYVGALVLTCPANAQVRAVHDFSVPAGRLSDALLIYAEQAEISISINDPRLDQLLTKGIRGRYDTASALRRLLKGSGFEFTFTDVSTVQLIRRPAPSKPARHQAAQAKLQPPPSSSSPPDIIVSATKQRAGIANYPASMAVIDLDRGDTARGGRSGTSYILKRLPSLASTNLGPGRNKIFIRGIADSSFNGANQATISQYLGDTRLIYSAPDPYLLLYDMERVEVLEGPQGTLYGAGTLGGIIRLTPRPPDARATSLAISGGTQLTQSGKPGFDSAAVINLPIDQNKLASRFVVYRAQEGGYIDDRLRGARDINRNLISGVRAAVRWSPDPNWTIDGGLAIQNLASRDGQYSEKDVGELARRSAIAQPFDNDYKLLSLTLTRRKGGTELVSATGYALHSVDSTFDATEEPGVTAPLQYEEDVRINLLTHETRLNGELGARGRWLAGITIVNNISKSKRRLGPPGNPLALAGVANTTLDTALFAEATATALSSLEITAGGRLSYVRQTSEIVSGSSEAAFEPKRAQFRALPTLALSWRPVSTMLFYGRYQEGYRPGALEVAGPIDQPVAQRFERDHIRTVELGWRFGTGPGAPFSGGVVASFAQWSDIQADLVDIDGLPYIANIGSGRVRNVSANLTWSPANRLRFEASGYLASSALTDPAPGFDAVRDRDLPNIADEGWRTAVRYTSDLNRAAMTLDMALHYVGSSKLAIRPPYDLPQGRYYELTAGARIAFGAIAISLDFENLLNAEANSFSFGNPFTVDRGMQVTPLRPRSVRIGLDASF